MKKISFTDEEFDVVKMSAEEDYTKIGEVYCPFLEIRVAFNVKGLDHVRMWRWNQTRNRTDQYGRYRLLHLAPQVLKNLIHCKVFVKAIRWNVIRLGAHGKLR